MIVSDTLSLAMRNLGQAKLRTTLTVLGVAIGIASLAGMVSLGVGIEEQTVGRFTASGMFDTVTVTQMSAGGRFGGRGRGGDAAPLGGRGGEGAGAAADAPRKALTDDAIAEIAALPDVREVYPNIRVPVELQFDRFQGFATLAGVAMSQGSEGAFQTFTAGAFFADETTHACLVTLDLARRMTERDPKELVGQTLTVAYAAAAPTASSGAGAAAPPPAPPTNLPGGLGALAGALGTTQARRVTVTFTIAGVVERDPGGMMAIGGGGLSGLMIPLAQARAIDAEAVTNRQALQLLTPSPPPARRPYQSLTVKVSSAKMTPDVEEKIKELGYGAISLTSMLQGAKRVFIVLDIILGLIGSIALAVSSLGIVNTMVMSILERTREIGIMKAIGGSDADVRGIFLVEAGVIGVLGGLAGVGLGWTVAQAINFAANIYIRQQGGTAVTLFSFPLWLILLAIGFSLLVSLIAGSYPARRAARLDPIQALRHD